MQKPLFIALEGIDGSGKTTQVRALADRLSPSVTTAEPTHTHELGLLLRDQFDRRRAQTREQYDPKTIALLFAADRLEHYKHFIRPALGVGQHVICDRYVMSSLAYQTLDCDEYWVKTINGYAPWPDLTFYIDVPVELAQERIAARAVKDGTPEQIFDAKALQDHVATAYQAVIATFNADMHERDFAMGYYTPPAICLVDGTQDPHVVSDQIYAIVSRRLEDERIGLL